jgi:hypothetical protein
MEVKELKKLKDNKGQMAGSTAGMVIALIMVAVVMGVLLTNLSGVIDLGTQGNATFILIQGLGWTALTILAVGVIAYVGKWIISIFS